MEEDPLGETQSAKEIERQVRSLQKELADLEKERDLLQLQPCRGDKEIRQKDTSLAEIEKRIIAINRRVRDLMKKRQEVLSEAFKKTDYESPFS